MNKDKKSNIKTPKETHSQKETNKNDFDKVDERIKILASGIAHNFNNALASMSLAIESLKLFSSPNVIGNDLMDKILATSFRMAKWTNQLLSYAGGGRYIIKELDLNDIVLSALDTLKEKSSDEISITNILNHNLPKIKADPAQLEQVLVEILSNALESTGNNGKISISTDIIKNNNELSIPEKFKNIEGIFVSIQDNGQGMDDEVLSRIFDPFFTTKFQGRGLGLAAAKGIIENHEGEITVESELGKGAKFKVFLPVISKPNILPQNNVSQDNQANNRKVLLINKDPNTQFILSTILESYNYEVLSSNTLEEGDRISQGLSNIDLLYWDIDDSDKNKIDILSKITKQHTEMKIIACINYNEKEILEKSAIKNISGIIHKPFQLDGLISTLRKVLKV